MLLLPFYKYNNNKVKTSLWTTQLVLLGYDDRFMYYIIKHYIVKIRSQQK